jgi:predicted nucleotidyltransferase
MKEIEDVRITIKNSIFEILHNAGASARIILFGSRAREDFTKFSDYDILLITDKTFEIKEKMNLYKKIREYLTKAGLDVDVIIKSDDEIQFFRDKPGSVVRNALKEGIAL